MKITHSFVGDTALVPEDPPPHGVGPVEWNNDHVVANFVPGDLPTITLTGDATGSGSGGTVPTTLATVNANVGSFTYASVTVNAKGLITAAASGTAPTSLELTDGTHDLTGVTKVTVSDMTVGGTAAAATLTPNLATALAPGIVQPDGTIITVAAGAITVPKASASAFGVVEVDNTTITASSGVISAVQPTGANPTATASNAAVNGSATTFMRSDAAPAVQLGSSSVFGVLKVDGTSITATGGVISAPGAGGGTVTTTGSPVSGNLTKFSGATSITNGDLSGDVTTSGALATTIKSSVALAGSPTTTTQTAGDNSTKVATTAFVTTAVNNAISGVNPAIAVSAATTAAGNTSTWTYNNGASGVGATFTGPANTAIVIDGFTFTSTIQSLLVKNDTQSPSGAFNGIYNLTALQTALTGAIFTRRLDYDTPSDINNTGAIPVVNGTLNGSTTWVLTSAVVTVGTDPLTYTQFTINPTTIVTTTGTPASGNLAKFSGTTSVTNTDLTGDVTTSGASATTLATVNSNVGSFTNANITVNAKGLVTAAVNGTVPTGANPTATASNAAVNGSAATFMRSDAAPAIQKASATQFGLVEVDGTSITAAAGVISAVFPTATSVVAAANSNTTPGTSYTDISGASVSLAAGTWLIFAQASATFNSATSSCYLRLFNATDSTNINATAVSGNDAGFFYSMGLFAIITIAATKTIKLQTKHDSTGSWTINATIDGGIAATGIAAVKLGN